jgi:hypothetical protein
MIENTHKYRLGLIVSKKGCISFINKDDLFKLYSTPSIETFEPIALDDDTFKALGFKKNHKKRPLHTYYMFDELYIKWNPFTIKHYYCVNVPESPHFNYVHELQDFLSQISIYFQNDQYVLTNFIQRNGGVKL